MNLIELARKFIAVDSSVSHGTRDVVRLIAQISNEWSLPVEVIEENIGGVSQASIVVKPKNNASATKTSREIALTTRLDTPDPGEYSQWVKTGANPYNASVSGDAMFGLGVADCKLDFLCKLLALKDLTAEDLKHSTPILVGTYGRESGVGTIRLLRKKNIQPKVALVGAPTDLHIANRAPGFAKLEISLPLSESEKKYIERHSRLEGGQSQSKIFSRQPNVTIRGFSIHDNPIIKMIDYLKNMPSGMAIISLDGGTSAEVAPDLVELELDLIDSVDDSVGAKLIRVGEAIKKMSTELMSLRDENFNPTYSTVNLGTIRMFSEEVKLAGVCRLIPAADRTVYEVWLDRLRQECSGAGAKFQIIDYKPPLITEEGGEFIRFLKATAAKTNQPQRLSAAAACTEANVFHRFGIECAIFGPGQPVENDKNALESVKTQELSKAVEFYKSVLQNFDRS